MICHNLQFSSYSKTVHMYKIWYNYQNIGSIEPMQHIKKPNSLNIWIIILREIVNGSVLSIASYLPKVITGLM